MFTWTPILTIKGKLLTKQFSELTMEEVKAHAQRYQDKTSREAQNSEMLIQCLKMEYAFSKPSLTIIILIPGHQLSKSGNS
jgi:hypothetical protein